MEPGYKLFNTPTYSFKQLKKKSSQFLRYPRHRRSSRLCLIAAERDSLRDLKQEKYNSYSPDSKNSNKIEILNFTNDSQTAQKLKIKKNPKNSPKINLNKIIINKSSRIRDSNNSHKKLVTSEIYSRNKNLKDDQKLYWTKRRKKEKVEEKNEKIGGYSTLDRSRIIEVSYFPTNHNGASMMDFDSIPRRFFKEQIPSTDSNKNARITKKYPLTPRAPKTSLSDYSVESDGMIQDFLDRQVKKQKLAPENQKWKGNNYFTAKESPESVNLSINNDQSQNLSSLKIDEKTETGFTFNIFKNKNLVKSEIYDLGFGTISNYEVKNSKPMSTLSYVNKDSKKQKKVQKKKKKDKKKDGTSVKKLRQKKLKMTKTSVQNKILTHIKPKSEAKIINMSRSVKSNTKGVKKAKVHRKKVFPIARTSVNLHSTAPFQNCIKFDRKKKPKIKSKKSFNLTLKSKKESLKIPVSEKEVKNSKYFKRTKIKHKRVMSGVDGLIGHLGATFNHDKDRLLAKTSKKNKTRPKRLHKSKSIKANPKKKLKIKVGSLEISEDEPKPAKNVKMSETPIYQKSIQKLKFDHFG